MVVVVSPFTVDDVISFAEIDDVAIFEFPWLVCCERCWACMVGCSERASDVLLRRCVSGTMRAVLRSPSRMTQWVLFCPSLPGPVMSGMCAPKMSRKATILRQGLSQRQSTLIGSRTNRALVTNFESFQTTTCMVNSSEVGGSRVSEPAAAEEDEDDPE